MIYYSHINEDNRVERGLLNEGEFPTVVSICGSGERVLSLIDSKTCKKMVVVDNNEKAIFLLQLKLTALKHLSVDDYLYFIGHYHCGKEDRMAQFSSLEKHLPPGALVFWREHLSMIKKGILCIGHFERFLHRARPIANLWLGKQFHNIFKTDGHQSRLSIARWKILQLLFSYKIVYWLLGNTDVAFTGSGAQLERIPAALNKMIQDGNASSSFMAHLVFKGNLLEMSETELPPSLQKKILATIKDRLLNDEIEFEFCVADLLQFLQRQNETGSPVFYSLSDILSFTDFDYLHSIIEQISGNENCIVGRSFLRNRLSPDQLSLFNRYGKVSLHDQQESTGMYQVFALQKQPKTCLLS